MTEGENNRVKAVELLTERLAFARASLELYDLAVERLKLLGGPYDSIRGHMMLMREEKRAHAEWLEEKLTSLGGDAAKAQGALALLNSGMEPPELFDGLMRAEVYDGGGWEALQELFAQSADEEAADEIRQMVHEHEEHFVFLGRIVARFARSSSPEVSP